MKSVRRLSPTKKAVLTIVALGVAWCVASAVLLAQPLWQSLAFLAYQALVVALPGFALLKLLRLELTPLEGLVTAYGLGVSAICVIYIAIAPFGAMELIPWAVGIWVVVSAWILRKRPCFRLADTGELRTVLPLCAVAAILSFVLLSMSTLTPDLSGTRQYFHDTLNGVALTTAASRGFPMLILQMSGTEHWYHIFFFGYNAVFKLVSGIDTFTVVTKMSVLTFAPFITALTFALGKRVLKSNRLSAVVTGLMLIIPSSAYVHYLYKDTIGFQMGLAFGLLSVLFFLKAEDQGSRWYNRYYMLSSLSLLVCVGAKGAIGVTFLFALCFALLMQLIRNKRMNILVQGLCYAIPFFILYFLLYRNGASDSMSFSPIYSAERTPFAEFIRGFPVWLYYPLILIGYIVSFDYIAFLALVAAVAWLVSRRHQPNTFVDLTFGGLLIGFVLMNLFKQMGSSEIYFLTSILPCAYILIALYLREKKKDFASLPAKSRVFPVLFSVVLLAAFVPNILNAVTSFIGDETRVNTGLKASITYSRFSDKRIFSDSDIAAFEAADLRANSITPQEYEAMLWIRENTPQDAVFVDGRYRAFNKYFYGSTFSERAFYLEGWGFVTMEDLNDNTDEKVYRDTRVRFFYIDEDEVFLLLLAEEGCDYVIISQFANPGFYLSDRYCDEVYANEHIAIYKIHEPA